MGASGGAFAYKFILTYFLYAVVLVIIWTLGFGQFYVSNYVNNPTLNTIMFNPAIENGYSYSSNWIPKSMLNDTQLQNLSIGTQVSGCVDCTSQSIYTLSNFYYWRITDRYNASWFTPVRYAILNGNGDNDTVAYTWVEWINTKTSVELSGFNLTSNTTGGSIITSTATLDPTDLWGQITLLFGFISGLNTFSSGIWFIALFNFALFMTFLYCFIGEILIPFGIHIPFV